MPEAYIYDAIRTPRGKGKSNGSLHSTKPVDLVVGLMHEMLVRNERQRRAYTPDEIRERLHQNIVLRRLETRAFEELESTLAIVDNRKGHVLLTQRALMLTNYHIGLTFGFGQTPDQIG